MSPTVQDRETLGLVWDVRKWFDSHNVVKSEIASKCSVSAAAIYLWMKAGVVPFSFFKAVVMMTAPDEGAQLLKSTTLRTGMRGFNITPEMRKLARQFDQMYDGEQVKTQNGHYVITAGSPKSEPVTVAPLVADHSQVEVLLSLCIRLKQDRDDAYAKLSLAESNLRLEKSRLEAANRHNASLRDEIQTWQELAEQTTNPIREFIPQGSPVLVDNAKKIIAEREPSLREEISRLPKSSGQQVS